MRTTLLIALLSIALAAPVPTEASRALAQGDAAPPEKKITVGGALLAGGLAATGHNTAAGITVAAQGAPLAGILIANRDKKEQRRSTEDQAARLAPELARSADAAPPEKKIGLGGLLLDGALLATDHDTAAGVAIASQGHPLAGLLIAEEGKKDHEEGHEDHGRRADVSEEKSKRSDAVAAASYHGAPEEKSMLSDAVSAATYHNIDGTRDLEGAKGDEP